MTASNISWTHEVWNWVTGCDRLSEGCTNCYAAAMAKRLKKQGLSKYQTDGDPRTSGPGFGIAVHEHLLREPLGWREGRRVFENSMSDLGHALIPRWALAASWAVKALTQRHHYQVLTKRPLHLSRILNSPQFALDVAAAATEIIATTPAHLGRWRLDLGGQRLAGDSGKGEGWSTTITAAGDTLWMPPWPPPNVWVGATVESDEYCGRADALRATDAAVRWLSIEPMLGPLPSLDLTGIDWVVVGGESGANHRPFDLRWARDIRDRCLDQKIPFYFKQVGGRSTNAGGRLLDGRTWDEYPRELAGRP